MNSINLNNIAGDVIQVTQPAPAENVAIKKAAEANFTQPVQHLAKDVKDENNKNIGNKPAEKFDSKEINGFVEKANNLVLIFDKSIKFVVDEKNGRRFIDVIDNRTNEVIKQIPPENIRKFVDAIESAIGLIIDKKA